ISSINSHPLKRDDDPCAPVLATKNPKYNDVKNCLISFPYDADIAKETVDVLKQYTSSFYSFFNQAREQAKPGFTFEPVDIIKELDKIIESNPKTEFEFMISLRNTYKKLRDAHIQLFPSCYGAFLYDQQLHLYSVLDKQGNQIIKVFDDLIDPTNIDCEVTSIDSVPAFDAIKNFANDQSFISRDLGVRFNNALTSISLEDGKPWKFGSEFTVRADLPETDSIKYILNCPNAKAKNVTREWLVTFLEFGAKSFHDDLCIYNNTGGERTKNKESHNIKKFETSPYIYHPKLKDVLSNRISKPSAILSKATLVHDATIAKFYKSIGSDFGIVVLIEDGLFKKDFTETLNGFKKLAKDSSIKKLVIDLSNNPGGINTFAQFINSLLLPSNSFNHTFFSYDMNVESDIVKRMITSSFNPKLKNVFSEFIDFETGKHFNSSEEFIGSRKIERGGSQSSYSTKFTLADLPSQINLPWGTKNMIILSNGASGSPASQYLQEVGQVPTVSVGGFANQSLSFASFSGGIPTTSFILGSILFQLQIFDFPDTDSHYKSFVMTLSLAEAYRFKNSDTVLEFDFKPADHRLFYDEKNIRDPNNSLHFTK
ncbi:9082_t:CDS:2, partial [Cetraspora pellucida]